MWSGQKPEIEREKVMKDTTKKLLTQIEETHDWIKGQVYSGGGTEYHSTDVCQVCGLRRHYESDRQNNIPDHYRFSDGEDGADLSLRQAIQRGCV